MVIQFQVDETYFSLYPFSQGTHAFTQIGRKPLYLFSFNIIYVRKLKSFFSWVKKAMGKNGGSSEQTKQFAVSFCAGWKYLAIGHCRFTTSFWLCLFEDRKDQMYLSGMFYEKVRQYRINNFVRTTLLSKNIIYKNNTYILEKNSGEEFYARSIIL